MPTVKVGDINIYYEIHGEGETLVLIMGIGGSIGSWFRAIPVLSREYRVVAFDNRGTGRSDKPDIPYTMEMMVEDTAGLLEAIGVDAAHILGISMGGGIAQEFALRYPERVTSLILGCTSCGGTHSIRLDEAAAAALSLAASRLPILAPEERTREMIPFFFVQEFIDNNPDFIEEFLAKALEYPAPLHGLMRQAGAAIDTYDRLPQIKAPTLVIAGDTDRMINVDNSRLLASRIPNAELVILENVGHAFSIAGEAEKIILDFLRRHRHSG